MVKRPNMRKGKPPTKPPKPQRPVSGALAGDEDGDAATIEGRLVVVLPPGTIHLAGEDYSAPPARTTPLPKGGVTFANAQLLRANPYTAASPQLNAKIALVVGRTIALGGVT